MISNANKVKTLTEPCCIKEGVNSRGFMVSLIVSNSKIKTNNKKYWFITKLLPKLPLSASVDSKHNLPVSLQLLKVSL